MSSALDNLKPYIHDITKAFLTYEAELAKRALHIHYPGWRIFSDEYAVTVKRPEVVLGLLQEKCPIRFVDVVWVVEHKVTRSRLILFFEIKTGRFSEEWIRQLMDERKGAFTAREVLGRLWGKGCEPVATILLLVAWKRELKRFLEAAAKAMDEDGRPLIRYITTGYVRGVELDVLYPFIRERANRLRGALGGHGE